MPSGQEKIISRLPQAHAVILQDSGGGLVSRGLSLKRQFFGSYAASRLFKFTAHAALLAGLQQRVPCDA